MRPNTSLKRRRSSTGRDSVETWRSATAEKCRLAATPSAAPSATRPACLNLFAIVSHPFARGVGNSFQEIYAWPRTWMLLGGYPLQRVEGASVVPQFKV